MSIRVVDVARWHGGSWDVGLTEVEVNDGVLYCKLLYLLVAHFVTVGNSTERIHVNPGVIGAIFDRFDVLSRNKTVDAIEDAARLDVHIKVLN